MKEQEPQEATPSEERTEAETPSPEEPRNRAERRHGAGLAHPYNPSVPGKRGGFNAPFQKGGGGNKRTHSHRKTG